MTEFVSILERLRPGYKVGGVITTPKRGLVNEAGSYAGESPLGTVRFRFELYSDPNRTLLEDEYNASK